MALLIISKKKLESTLISDIKRFFYITLSTDKLVIVPPKKRERTYKLKSFIVLQN